EHKSVCPDCSTGCSIYVDANKDIVYRLRPRENSEAQGYFMCDEGRFDYPYINSRERILRPLVRRKEQVAASSAEEDIDGTLNATPEEDIDGTLNAPASQRPSERQVPAAWEEVLPTLRRELAEAAKDGGAVAAVLSPFLTCEEVYLLASYVKGLSPQARLALGPIPVLGEDDTYPKDRRGRPLQPVKFTIRAEKCPNRRGVEEVLKHFQGEVIGFDEIVKAAGELKALYLTAGYSPRAGAWMKGEQIEALRSIPLLIVQDLLPSAVSHAAKYVLPASSFAEKDGTFVNHAGLAQAIHRAARPSHSCRTDGQIFMDLMQRRGLVHAPTLRSELAAEVAYFAPLASGEIGEYGVRLEPAK
ncbi:MAG TPA: molybdopterin-dependent oxidoreductase, partial [Gemmataceae bacterium]|nr:molybdopterin-dependent oxidoreductase [Gemmataceae bacterium]